MCTILDMLTDKEITREFINKFRKFRPAWGSVTFCGDIVFLIVNWSGMEFVNTKVTNKLGLREFSIHVTKFPSWNFLLSTITIFLSSLVIAYRLELEVSTRYLAVVFPTTLIFVCLKLQRVIITESLLIFPSLGLQLMRTTALGTKTGIYFVPITKIKSIIINESIKKQHVITYLCLILHVPDNRGSSLVPIFEETLPKIEVLKIVYREIYEALQEFAELHPTISP